MNFIRTQKILLALNIVSALLFGIMGYLFKGPGWFFSGYFIGVSVHQYLGLSYHKSSKRVFKIYRELCDYLIKRNKELVEDMMTLTHIGKPKRGRPKKWK